MEQKKNDYLKAILFCILTCLGGGLVFGLIYGLGYYLYVLPVAEVLLGVIVYQKFAKANGLNMTIAVLLSTALVLAFNLLSIIICEVIFLARALNLPFGDAYTTFFYYVNNDANVASAFNSTIGSASGITLLGAVVAIIYLVITMVAAKKQAQKAAATQPANATQETPAENKVETVVEQPVDMNKLYNDFYKDVKNVIKEYSLEKDSEKFKTQIKEIKAKYILGMDEQTKAKMRANNDKLLATNPEKLKAQTLQTMNKLLK